MIFALTGIGLLFIGLGFILNKENASFLLSGYNMMSKAEQLLFPLERYIKKFRAFHIRLGLFYIAVGWLLWYTHSPLLGHHMGVTPIIAYMYFIVDTKKMYPGKNKGYLAALIILAITAGIVLAVFLWSDRDNEVLLTEEALSISGPYGMVLSADQIESVSILYELPEIHSRIHGISTDQVYKGMFGGPNGARYHLLLEKPYDHIIRIDRVGDRPVLLSLEDLDEETFFLELEKWVAVSKGVE